jgi:hypothetical protein
MNFKTRTDSDDLNKSDVTLYTLSKNHEILPGCDVQNYETTPTGITSIGGIQLEIKIKQCRCVSRNYRF